MAGFIGQGPPMRPFDHVKQPICQGSVVCVMCSRLLCPYMVCFLSLFDVIYELSMFQLCLSRYLLITLCILVLSFEFDFVWSTRYSPVFLSMSALPCPALLVKIKDYYLSLYPRLRVLVPPSCVHRDRRPDLTVSGAHSPRFVFHF